jgi:hypothetical protein
MLVYRVLEKAPFSERVVEGKELDIFAQKCDFLFVIFYYSVLLKNLLTFSPFHLRFYNKARPFLLGIQDPQVLFDELPFVFVK